MSPLRRPVGKCYEKIVVCSENHMKPINTLCGEQGEFLNVKAGGNPVDHCALGRGDFH
jgi:hypothetical protein